MRTTAGPGASARLSANKASRVKFVFPRGDATSLLFGFDAAGKITGVAIGGMAGD